MEELYNERSHNYNYQSKEIPNLIKWINILLNINLKLFIIKIIKL